MKRRTLDILFSVGGVAIAVLLLIFGVFLQSQASFANNYIADQLSAQKIVFPPADSLSGDTKVACMEQYAGMEMTTGAQAECYANHYIAVHVAAATGGQTYAQLGGPQRALRAEIAKAKETNDPKLADLEAQLATIDAQRETAFKGETLRGMLLTVYGFSILGAKAAMAGVLAYVGAAVMALLSLAGFLHAFRTPETVPFAPVEKEPARS